MARKKRIVTYTAKELAELVEREGSGTDWQKADAMTDAEIEASIAADADEADMVMDWDNTTVEMPQPKAVLSMRIDKDILDYFRQTGKGYQTRINAVLRSYVKQQGRRSG
jgi:uncharacterized protein (DUF4415 family)